MSDKTTFDIPLDLSVDVWLTGDGKVNVTVLWDGVNTVAEAHLTYEELFQSCGFTPGPLEAEEEAQRKQTQGQILKQMEKFVREKLGKKKLK